MDMRRFCFLSLVFLALGAVATLYGAPSAAQSISVSLDPAAEVEAASQTGFASRIVQLVLLLTILSLAPSILIMMTSFIRIVVVLSLLRTALGVQQSPPNPVIISLALFLTAFVMAPTLSTAYTDGVAPFMNEELTLEEAFPKATAPLKTFMLTQTRENDLALFFDLAEVEPETPEATPLHILTPAFVISELRRAFEIGFLIFIPFLVIDMVISSILMAMGMLMLPPIVISLPFKLIFFVLIDGWHMVAGSLVESFAVG
ncbi:MAG: flagellar type III secretion system pore protein FliP [Pseudomonadota bacterium]